MMLNVVLPTQTCDRRDRERSRCSKGTLRQVVVGNNQVSTRNVTNATGRHRDASMAGVLRRVQVPDTRTDSTQGEEKNQGSCGRRWRLILF